MATKTLTITENAYNILSEKKLEGESFSQEIIRIMSEKKKRPLSDFFGILSEIDSNSIKNDIKKFRELDKKIEKSRRA